MLDSTQISSVIDGYAHQYDMEHWEILSVIEQSIAETITLRYGRYSEAYLNEGTLDLEVFVYTNRWGLHQQKVPLKDIRGWKQIAKRLEHNVDRYVSVKTSTLLRPRIGSITKGAISAIHENGDVFVEIIAHQQITAKWQMQDQPVVDRSEGYLYGENKLFRVKNIFTGMENGQFRTYVLLERNSKAFVNELIKRYSRQADNKAVCVRRKAGEYCEIWAQQLLEPDVLKRIVAETGDYISVFTGTKEEIKQKKRLKTRRSKHRKSLIVKPGRELEVDLLQEFLDC